VSSCTCTLKSAGKIIAGFTKFQLVDVVLVVALVAKTFWNDFHFNDFFYRRDYTVLCPAVYILFIFTWQLIFCLVHLNPLLNNEKLCLGNNCRVKKTCRV